MRRRKKASPDSDPTCGAPTRSACGLRTHGDSVVQGGSVAASPLRGVGLGLARNVDEGETPSHYTNTERTVENRVPHCKLHDVGETTSCRFGEAISGAGNVDEGETPSHYTKVGQMGC